MPERNADTRTQEEKDALLSLYEAQAARCPETQEAFGKVIVQCERERGHGGAHSATIDDPAADPLYTYVVSWWPR